MCLVRDPYPPIKIEIQEVEAQRCFPRTETAQEHEHQCLGSIVEGQD